MKNKITFTFAKKKDFKKLARCAYTTGAETFLFEDQTIPIGLPKGIEVRDFI